MALGDIYELKHVARDADQKIMENVYFYQHVSDPVGGSWPTQAQRLAEDWNTDVLTPMLTNLPSAYTAIEIRTRNLFDPADNYVKPISRAGSRTAGVSELMPSWISVVATLSTDNGLVHKGRKMLYGLFEADQSFGVMAAFGVPFFVARAALCLLGVSNLFGGFKAFYPVVVKRIREGTPGNYTYRLPTSAVEAVYGNIQSAVISMIVSSQDTRKK